MKNKYSVIVSCAYCDREMATSQIMRHETICIQNPEVAQITRECLRLSSDGDFIGTQRDYDETRQIYEGAPNAITLMQALDMSWDEIAVWAGLRPHSERILYTLEKIRELSIAHHNGQIGPSSEEWRTYRSEGTLLAESLVKSFGSWHNVLLSAGLRMESRSYYIMHSKQMKTGGDERAEEYIKAQRQAAKTAEHGYPLLPGTWKRKSYALWPSGQAVTSTVYELR